MMAAGGFTRGWLTHREGGYHEQVAKAQARCVESYDRHGGVPISVCPKCGFIVLLSLDQIRH